MADPLAGVPELTTYEATSVEDKVAALKLVADSVAQQRQLAARALLFHPATLALFAGFLAVVVRLACRDGADVGLVLTTAAGAATAGLAVVRWMTSGYIALAERIGWAWLGDGDAVLVTRFGDEIIGVVILAFEREDGTGAEKGAGVKGLIRAWTVRLRYRGKGEGGALLQDAVKAVKARKGKSIDFAEDHAYSTRVLHSYFNSEFDRRDYKARKLLQATWES